MAGQRSAKAPSSPRAEWGMLLRIAMISIVEHGILLLKLRFNAMRCRHSSYRSVARRVPVNWNNRSMGQGTHAQPRHACRMASQQASQCYPHTHRQAPPPAALTLLLSTPNNQATSHHPLRHCEKFSCESVSLSCQGRQEYLQRSIDCLICKRFLTLHY